MVRRLINGEDDVFRGVLCHISTLTGKVTYSYVGPYTSTGSCRGAVTRKIQENKRYGSDAKIVAVKVQKSSVWEDLDNWIEV